MRKNRLLLLLLLSITLPSMAQWECPGKIPAHLTPFHKNVPINWALEISPSIGIMTDRTINSGMVFGALQYYQGSHELYVEGGMKFWQNINDLYSANDRRLGLREAYYSFSRNNHQLKTGFMSMRSGDFMLVNERAYGANYNFNNQALTVDFSAATVTKDFSRAGIFCTKSYIYNLVTDRPAIPLGSDWGETNFTSFSVSLNPEQWKTARNKKEDESAGDDESSEFEEFEEFESFDEFEDVEEEAKSPFITPTKLGFIFYNEFGSLIQHFNWWSGLYTEFRLPLDINLQGEVLWQQTPDESGIIAYAGLQKVHIWPKGNRTMLSAGYYTMISEKENTGAAMSFANMWYGEVMRLDGVDMPFWQVSAKHNFPKIKTHLKLQYVQQQHQQQMRELDFAIGKTWFRHVKTTLMASRLEANELEKEYYMLRLEVRVTI